MAPASEPPRLVALAFHEQRLGGASVALLRIMPLLEERGWRFACWTPGEGALRDELAARGYQAAGEEKLLRFSLQSMLAPPGAVARLRSLPGYLAAFRAWLSQQQAALLHCNTWLTVPEAIAAGGLGCPTIQYVHETVPAGLKGRAASLVLRCGTPSVVGISQDSVAELRRHGVRARLIHNGVPLPQAPRRSPDRRALVIGTLGTIAPRKGSDLFVELAKRMRVQLPEAELRMIGPLVEGPARPWADGVTSEAQRIGVRCGPTEDPVGELGEWDIAVVPSRDEPFGLAAAEAMALGVPVVAARVGGLPEVVGPDAGLLVPPGDPAALAAAVGELARDPGRRSAMGTAGRARVAERFSLDRQAELVHEAYRDTLASGARARLRPRGAR